VRRKRFARWLPSGNAWMDALLVPLPFTEVVEGLVAMCAP
jgi:hypothetical protein